MLFYANEHEPMHVHGKSDGRECRAEILLVNGAVTNIRYAAVAGRAPLTLREMQYFEELVTARAEEIGRDRPEVDRLLRSQQAGAARAHHPEAQVTDKPINIVSATPAGGYRLRLDFDDGTAQTVDFQPFLARSRHPEIRAFLDPARFASFRLEHGELVWGDYELCFPIIDLYRNRIEHRDARETAAGGVAVRLRPRREPPALVPRPSPRATGRTE